MQPGKTISHSLLLKIQGLYYLLTGMWPIVSIQTFLQVTGPKTDLWLVKVIGLLIAINGITLLLASFSTRRINVVGFLAIALAIGFALLEVIFYFQGLISPVYLLDAGLETLFFIFWSVNYTTTNE